MTKTSVKVRDAASLLIYRRGKQGFEVLMGRRHKNHVFMPHRLVFPGGAADPEDMAVTPATPLHPEIEERLCRGATRVRARALAAAAIRETWEETGLMVAAPLKEPLESAPVSWRDFYDAGVGPDFGALDYFFRAITPPGKVRRFDARFFLVPAERAHGDIRSNGELIDIDWYAIADVKDHAAVHGITSMVLREAEDVLDDPALLKQRGARYSRHVRGKRLITYDGMA
ncbi:MAG: NUDIX domain-containing protein [Rhodospirillales bacterium]